MAEAPISLDSNQLMFWKLKASTYPRLVKLAKQTLSIPATNVPSAWSERVFSTAVIMNNKRACLGSANVDKLVGFLEKKHEVIK